MPTLRTFATSHEVEKILARLPKRTISEFIRNAIKEKSTTSMQAVILCGGLGTRLYPITKDIPKSMLKVNGKPFLEHQIDIFKQNGVKDIILCVGYKANEIKKYFGDGSKFGVRITYGNEINAKYDTGGVIKHVEKFLANQFFVIYGDSYLPIDFKEVMNHFFLMKKKGLMTVFKNHDMFDKSNVAIKNGQVTVYDKQKSGLVHIDYGLSILDKSIIEQLPENKKISLGDIFKILIEKEELAAFEVYNRFYEIGSFQGLKDFEELMKK